MYVCVYIYVCMCIYIYMYIYIYVQMIYPPGECHRCGTPHVLHDLR